MLSIVFRFSGGPLRSGKIWEAWRAWPLQFKPTMRHPMARKITKLGRLSAMPLAVCTLLNLFLFFSQRPTRVDKLSAASPQLATHGRRLQTRATGSRTGKGFTRVRKRAFEVEERLWRQETPWYVKVSAVFVTLLNQGVYPPEVTKCEDELVTFASKSCT